MRTWTRSFVLALALGGIAACNACTPTATTTEPEPSGTGGTSAGSGGTTSTTNSGGAGPATGTGGSAGTGGSPTSSGGAGGEQASGAGGTPVTSGTGGSGGSPVTSGSGGASASNPDAGPSAPGPGGSAKPSAGCGKPNPAVGTRMITTQGKNQSYWVAIPPNYDPAKPYPLGFAFHGFGLDDKTCHDGSECPGFRTEVGQKAITVFPKSISAGWEYPVMYLGQNVKYVEDLIALMKSEYCVDENRIFVSGVSSGGHFTHHLSCQLGDKLWAAVPIAAYLEPAAMANCKGFPAQIHIRGITDSLKKGQSARDFQAMRNGCPTPPANMEAMEKETLDAFTAKTKPPKTMCASYEGCTQNQLRYCVFSQVTYNGGTHGWPDDGGKLIAEFLAGVK
jgi:poly(3-hydroxybutyrate) depolymerase